jgi:hypothetical protein
MLPPSYMLHAPVKYLILEEYTGAGGTEGVLKFIS